MQVAVTGASGLVGSALGPALAAAGHGVRRLVRRTPRDPGEVLWDGHSVLDRTALAGVDAMVHLAGENIGAGRWTAERKRRIHDSRAVGTRLLAAAAAELEPRPRVLVCAS